MDRSADLYVLGHSEVLRNLSAEALEQVRSASVRRKLAKGETLFDQGAAASAFFIIVQGRLRLAQSTADGQQVIIRYIGPGESAGYSAIAGREAYSSTVVAVDDSVLMSWTRSRLQELLTKHPQIAANALAVVHTRYEELQARFRELATEPVEKRIAHTILRLVQQAGRRTAAGIEVAFPLSRQDIAEMAGTTLHTVSRTISAWENDGIIDSGRRRVVVRRPEELGVIANQP
jgi:CRP/FNR family transcriptional regulator, nitrogen oxide reductase regulator